MFKTRKVRPDGQGDQRTYTSTDVAKIAQVSLRQLQWWDERKVVSPRHEGHKRIYLAEEVVEITVIAELRRKGFSLQKIRRVLRFLQREMGRRLADVLSSDSRLHLLTDGKVHLPGRSAGSDHRSVEKRQAADVPGVRQRSGASGWMKDAQKGREAKRRLASEVRAAS